MLTWDEPRPGCAATSVPGLRTVADGGGDRRGGLRSETLDAGDPLDSLDEWNTRSIFLSKPAILRLRSASDGSHTRAAL